MATPHTNAPHVLASQTNKETTINLQADAIDEAVHGLTDFTITGDKILTATEFRGAFSFRLSGSPGSAFGMGLPASINKHFAVLNNTGQTV